MIRQTSVNTANDPEVQAPVLNFIHWDAWKSQGIALHNDGMHIDFVTDGDNLYVCVEDGLLPTAPTIDDQGGLLKLVSKGSDGTEGRQGAQGRPGHTPRITAKFVNNQVELYADGTRVAVSNDLTGPAWIPERSGNKIVWKKGKDSERPATIDLDELRAEDYKPVIFRTDSDNTKRDTVDPETSGPAKFIQWKYEGDEYWNNLISIDELMNLALAGICFFQKEDATGAMKWHIGHREVVKAYYDATASGKKIISDVALGDVLFDAGEVPWPDYSWDAEVINQKICELKRDLDKLKLKLKNYVQSVNNIRPDSETGNVNVPIPTKLSELENDVPYVKSVNDIRPDNNGNVTLTIPDLDNYYNKQDSDARFQPKGNYIKTINGEGPDPETGNIQIEIAGYTFDVKIENNKLYKKENGGAWIEVGNVGGSGEATSGVTEVVVSEPASADDDYVITVSYADGTSNEYTIKRPVSEVKVEGTTLYVKYDSDSEYVTYQLASGGIDEATVRQLIQEAIEGLDLGDTYVTVEDLGADYYNKDEIDQIIQDIAGGEFVVESYRPFTLYQRTNSNTVAPTKPTKANWTWNTSTNMLTAAEADGWSNSPVDGTGSYLWEVYNTYTRSNGLAIYEWTEPVCMTGNPGKDGEDADNREFIYKVVASKADFDNLAKPTTPAPDAPTGWTDNAQGIEAAGQIEAYCYAIKNHETDEWSEWQGPFVWSMWGENGVDGNGIEYIFFAQNDGTITPGQDPSVLDAVQEEDYVPTTENSSLIVDWTDEPHGVNNTDKKYEFVSIRKFKNGVWSKFSEPKVWAYFYEPDYEAIVGMYQIVPISSSITKITENDTSYPQGTVKFQLNKNGENVAYTDDYNLEVYTCGTLVASQGEESLEWDNEKEAFSVDVNVASVTIDWNNDSQFTQIFWRSEDGKLLASYVIPILIPGEKGEKGDKGEDSSTQSLEGAVMRVSVWTSDPQKIPVGGYSKGNIAATDGVKYLDVVYHVTAGADEGYYYKCNTNATSGEPGVDESGWIKMDYSLDSIFDTLVANNAYIKNLTSKQVIITNANNQVEAGLVSSVAVNDDISTATRGDIRIFAGQPAPNGNLSTTPFNVTNTGELTATNAHITGEINATSGTFTGTVNANAGVFSNVTIDDSCTIESDLTAGSLNTAAGTNGVATKIQEGTFEISGDGCSDAKIAFGIDSNTCIPYMYVTNTNGNIIWQLGGTGFNWNGTVLNQEVNFFPGHNDLMLAVETDSTTGYTDGVTYSRTSGNWKQYFQFTVGGVSNNIEGEYHRTPRLPDGTIYNPYGYTDPYGNTTELVDLPSVTVDGTEITINNLIYCVQANHTNISAPDAENVIEDGLYVSKTLDDYVQQCTLDNIRRSSGTTPTALNGDFRVSIPLYNLESGKQSTSTPTVSKYVYGTAWSGGSSSITYVYPNDPSQY